MAGIVNEVSGARQSVQESSNGQHHRSGEALSVWRSSDQVENGTPSTSPPYWDTDEDDDYGVKPSELFGEHTWTIEKFSEINKRELRSDAFEAGGYKWYILIYPQGCDVCNHLSLFLCVANHDKLLPGWSHFAQFTIAVVNKDSKKTKFSDTLHRFWKKEHDWGWKKFMELPKLQDGFIDDSDSLLIKAQVQVIRERADRPFRCLDCKYRRELVRVYLSNVEQICRRFVEDRRSKLGRLIEDKARWTSFCAFWLGMDQNSRLQMSREKMDVIIKVVVKHFFIEKEVTSTLVMDSLYSGLKALETQTKNKKRRPRLLDAEELPAPIVSVDKDMFILVDDVLLLLERAALEPLPPKDEKGPQNRTKDSSAGEEVNKEAIERDERRLTELGRRTVEIFVLAHIFSNKIEVAYQEAIALKRQEELIREEEEAWLAETEQRAKRGAAEREKKSKKKQAKQKRNKNKGKDKDKRREENVSSGTLEKDIEENQHEEEKDFVTEKAQSSAEKPDILGDISDISDSVDGSADMLRLDLEDRDSSSGHWDMDAVEIHPSPSSGNSRGRGSSISIPNGVAERRNHSTLDDSSSTCSNDSIRSGVANGSYKGNASNFQNQKSPSKGKNQQTKMISESRSLARETDNQPSTLRTEPKSPSYSSKARKFGESDRAVVSQTQESESSGKRSPIGKERDMAQPSVNSVDMDRPKEKSAAVLSSPKSSARNPSPLVLAKLEKKVVPNTEAVPIKKAISAGSSSSNQVVPSSDIHSQTVGLRADMQTIAPTKPTEKLVAQPATTISRPSSAPIILAMQASPIVSAVQATTSSLARSVSSVGRLGPDPSHHGQSYIPHSYKHAIVGNPVGQPSSNHPSSQGTGVTTLPAYSQPPPHISAPYQSGYPFAVGSQDVSGTRHLWTGRGFNSQRDTSINMNRDALKPNPYTPVSSSRSLNHIDIQIAKQAQSLMTDDFPHLDIINDLLEEEHGSSNGLFTSNSMYLSPQLFNNQYSYHDNNLNVTGELLSGGRSRSFSEEGYRQAASYTPGGMDYMPHPSTTAPYSNGQMDGLRPSQWQMANMDLSLLAMRKSEDATSGSYSHSFYGLDSSNPSFSPGNNNGYTEFKPSNGH